MKANFKDTIASMINDAGHGIQWEFFKSETPKISKWTKEDDEEYLFVKAAEAQGISYTHVDNYGGEGQGDEYWSVYEFTRGKDNVYVKFSGWYQSYNGSEYDEYFFVEPKEKVVTEYVKVQ